MKVKSLSIVVSLVAVVLAASGCASSDASEPVDEECQPAHEFSTLEPGVLKVAAINSLPAFLGLSAEGPFEGFAAELLPLFAEENCLEIEYQPMTGAAAVLELKDGKVDMIGGLIMKTAERGEIFAQTNEVLLYERAAITSQVGYTDVDDLENLTVGVTTGSSVVAPLEAAIGTANIKYYQSYDDADADLVAGRIDATVTPSIPQIAFLASHPDADLEIHILDQDPDYPDLTRTDEGNWPHTKGNTEMTAALDAFYKQIREDGTLKKAIDGYGLNDPFYLDGK